jgi:uncharacterized protein (DUF433 family)
METGYQEIQQPSPPLNTPPVSLDQCIVVTPGVRGGRPRLADTRLSVAEVVTMHRQLGQSLDEIAATYELPFVTVYAAMAYYYAHQDEIDRSIAEDRAFAEAFRREHHSPLQEKLARLPRG